MLNIVIMKQSTFSLIISLLSFIVLVIPFTTNNIYDGRKKWFKRLNLKGWILTASAITIIYLTYKKDDVAEMSTSKQKTQDSLYKVKNDSLNLLRISETVDSTTAKATRVYYKQLIEMGLSKAEADKAIQIAFQIKLKEELKTLKKNGVSKPMISVNFKRDSIDFGKEKIWVHLTPIGGNVPHLNVKVSIGTYEKNKLNILIINSTGFYGVGVSVDKTSFLGFDFQQAYYVDAYVIHIYGSYMTDYGESVLYDRFFWFNQNKASFGEFNSEWSTILRGLFVNGKGSSEVDLPLLFY